MIYYQTFNHNNCRRVTLLTVSNFIKIKFSEAVMSYGNSVISEMPHYTLAFDMWMLIWLNVQSLVV